MSGFWIVFTMGYILGFMTPPMCDAMLKCIRICDPTFCTSVSQTNENDTQESLTNTQNV